jgi:hypothetical protein
LKYLPLYVYKSKMITIIAISHIVPCDQIKKKSE